MCGVFGYDLADLAIPAAQRAVLVAALGHYNDRRGGDSWGAFAPDAPGDNIWRGLGDIGPSAWQFGEHPRLFGHTRFATHGKKVLANAHPFVITGQRGEVVGAHNGVIHNHAELNAMRRRNFDVDSQHIFQHIADGEDLTDLEGYGTVWWFHNNQARLCKLSHSGDLSVVGIKDKSGAAKGVVFSSLKSSLEDALKLAGMWGWAFEYEVPVGQVYIVRDGLWRPKGERLNLGTSTYRGATNYKTSGASSSSSTATTGSTHTRGAGGSHHARGPVAATTEKPAAETSAFVGSD